MTVSLQDFIVFFVVMLSCIVLGMIIGDWLDRKWHQ